jgi:integrase
VVPVYLLSLVHLPAPSSPCQLAAAAFPAVALGIMRVPRNLYHLNRGQPLSKSGRILDEELGDWAIWSVVEASAKEIGIEHFGAHDLRNTCAKLCRKNGGDLEQIKGLLGQSSIQTTERYLGRSRRSQLR